MAEAPAASRCVDGWSSAAAAARDETQEGTLPVPDPDSGMGDVEENWTVLLLSTRFTSEAAEDSSRFPREGVGGLFQGAGNLRAAECLRGDRVSIQGPCAALEKPWGGPSSTCQPLAVSPPGRLVQRLEGAAMSWGPGSSAPAPSLYLMEFLMVHL